jgi:hypothetical protein
MNFLNAQEKFGNGNVVQVGLVVNNIEKASEKWAAILGFNVDEMKESTSHLEQNGGEVVQSGDFTGGSYSYINLPEVGIIFELLTKSDK